MSETEQPPKRIEVELSDHTDDYEVTWVAVDRATQVLELANRALQASGIELVPIWRGHHMHEPEVVNQLDENGIVHNAPAPWTRQRISVEKASEAATDARMDEMDRIYSRFSGQAPSSNDLIRAQNVLLYARVRKQQIAEMAARPPDTDQPQ